MIIKKKSMIVVLISSAVISIVMILTLISYLIYMELKAAEFNRSYHDRLEKILKKP